MSVLVKFFAIKEFHSGERDWVIWGIASKEFLLPLFDTEINSSGEILIEF